MVNLLPTQDHVMQKVINPRQATSERLILREHLEKGIPLKTDVAVVQGRPVARLEKRMQNILGLFRTHHSRKAVIADMEFLDEWKHKRIDIPAFLEAGPREDQRFPRRSVKAAIVTTGGLAPGLHCVIHSILKRHCQIYRLDVANGRIYGVYNSFKGLCNLADNLTALDLKRTEEWLDQGGSKLGIVRYKPQDKNGKEMKGTKGIAKLADDATWNLKYNDIDILYVLGGDGSMRVAHEIAKRNPTRSVIGLPKTMDNDILWVWQSFGFDTAVEQATRVINTLRTEAEATRRIGIIQLFGAKSGYVAANATLASGHVDAVLIPEVIKALTKEQAETYLDEIIGHVEERIREKRRQDPHGIIVVAEGVGTYLEAMGACIGGTKVTKRTLIDQMTEFVKTRVRDARGKDLEVFNNEPRHYIRSLPANAHDQIYCERLGALAVDTALAGFTDCMISNWLTEYVLVPMEMVTRGQKSVFINGMFWKQVVSSTGQPLSPAECVYQPHVYQEKRKPKVGKRGKAKPAHK